MFSCPLRRIILLIVTASLLAPSVSAKVEAIKGKRYRLTSRHGPWMIMVAALRDVPPERRSKNGLSAWQAADELVYELRKLGVPAYTYLQKMQVQEVSTFAANSGAGDGKYISQHEAIAVLAGNFSSPDLKQAKLILQYLKNSFEPEFLKDENSGAIIPRTPGRPNPMNRAHMTTNPLMSAADVKRNSLDPLIKQLNSGSRYSLLKNRGRYTLRIATFKGTSILQVGNTVHEKAQKNFDKMFGSNLDAAGTQAWELTQALRTAAKLGYGQNYEAWVFHDRYQSYVTIGSFESRSDPRIAQLAKQFHAKTRMHQGSEVMTAESFSIPRNPKPGRDAEKFWVFDVTPRLIEVPRERR